METGLQHQLGASYPGETACSMEIALLVSSGRLDSLSALYLASQILVVILIVFSLLL